MRITLLFALFMAGCSTTSDYKEYLSAQAAANEQAAKNQKPLLELEAMDGQAITGLKAVRVFTPTAAPQVQQMRESDFVSGLKVLAPIIGTTLGIRYAGQAAIGLSNSIGTNNATISSQIQAPGTVNTTTNTLSGTGTLGSGAFSPSDSTHAPTVVVQPAPTIVTQPAPTIVQVPAGQVVQPVIVNPVIVP